MRTLKQIWALETEEGEILSVTRGEGVYSYALFSTRARALAARAFEPEQRWKLWRMSPADILDFFLIEMRRRSDPPDIDVVFDPVPDQTTKAQPLHTNGEAQP